MTRTDQGSARAAVIGVVSVLAVVGILVYLSMRPTTRVLVVGDSVTFMSQGQIDKAFGRDVTVDIVALPGRTSTTLRPSVEAAVARQQADGDHLDRAVFLVGYNDVLFGDVASADLDRLVETSASYECAAWLVLPSSPAMDPARVAAWNERIRVLVASHPNLQMVTAWADAVNAAPDALLVPDGIHPSPVGQAKLAEVMATGLTAACRSAQPAEGA